MLFYPSRQTRQSRRGESAKVLRPQNTSTRTHPPSRLLQDGDTQTRFCAIPFLPRVARTASTHVGRPFRPRRSPSVPPLCPSASIAHQRNPENSRKPISSGHPPAEGRTTATTKPRGSDPTDKPIESARSQDSTSFVTVFVV